MLANVQLGDTTYRIDLTQGQSLALDFEHDQGVTAWYAPKTKIEAVQLGDFIGDTRKGASVNTADFTCNIHGNGTHTECVGHISEERIDVGDCFQSRLYKTQLLTVSPQEVKEQGLAERPGDGVVAVEDVLKHLDPGIEALVIRTLPNTTEKRSFQYTETNPVYLGDGMGKALRDRGIQHVVVDVPSVDREEDGGLLHNHKGFWRYPEERDMQRTITELAFIPNDIGDGHFLMNIEMLDIQYNASPSRPILYKILNETK